MSNLEGAKTTQEHEQNDQSQQEWETMARAWLCSFPEAKEVMMAEVEAWIDSNLASLPEGLRSIPRPDLCLRLISIQNCMRLPIHEEREVNQPELPHARFQRTDQWIPVYSWLETLDKDEVVKSKEIADWLAENSEVQEQLCARHSRYHLMHYIKKCHLKILKRREKRKGLEQLDKDTPTKVQKDVAMKHPALLPSSSPNNLPKDSDLYMAKRNEAYRKYELSASVTAAPFLLGNQGEDTEWVTVQLESPKPSRDDWVGVFSPANFNSATCPPTGGIGKKEIPYICTAPIKYKYANHSNSNYIKTGKTTLKFQLINQRADFSFALFSGGLSNPKLVAVSNPISFANPKAPVYPRLALGKSWDEMTVTWTSGYDINEAIPFVEWGPSGGRRTRSPAGTLTFNRNSMCGEPARTVGWRDPGFIHTSFLKELWPNQRYSYRLGHILSNGSYIWSKKYSFKASPYPGQNSLQRVIIFGDMGKAERDGSNEYADYQPGSLNTTDQLIKDLDNFDIVFHIGDLPYANGYISQWDQFTAQVQEISSAVPYMIASGNHERDWPNTGSFFNTPDSGGECGVPAETMYYFPAENRAKFWYQADYGMLRFCIGDSEHDWREGSEQYKFIEHCLATVDRKQQPWLIFSAHRPLGYSSNAWYGKEGSFEEPEGREHLQKLWQKYKVDIAFYGHVHNYERICPIYQNQCVNSEKTHYSGTVNGTIHIVVGGGGSHLSDYTPSPPVWSLYRDRDFGFGKLTAFNHSYLLFEYKKSSDGKVYDYFTISRDYRDVLACVHDGCEKTTLAA